THDFGSLIISIKEGGSSTADIAQHVISKRAKLIFSLFVWLALILIIAVFAYFCADTFVKEPKIVLPSLGLIPVAMVVGVLLYNFKANTVLTTILGLVCLAGLILLGNRLALNNTLGFWIVVLLVYCYFASILPVNILLQPRDYLSSYLLFFGVGVGYLGLFIAHPKITTPFYNKWATSEGYLWPALFITIACGAISGFHTLVASGTSSKQIANERHAKRIGYGAMVTEGLVAVMAVLATTTLFSGRSDFGTALKNIGPIKIFGDGYGIMTRHVLGASGAFIAITILNAFILTTLDTATRISRYLTEELFSIKNRYISTLLIVVLSALLAFSGKGLKIWQVFGASNQLMAALALFVLTCWLLARKKNAHFTLWPALFMFFTTVAALVFEAVKYFRSRDIVLLTAIFLLLILAAFMFYEAAVMIIKRKAHA
ncbi:MAG: carbon starvation protein A, partial [Deltaproteobacteria bacterium]